MQGNPSGHRQDAQRGSLAAIAGLLVVSILASALLTSAVLLIVDRFDSPALIVSGAPLPTIAAEVQGAVATPGVYPLPAGARLDDLVRRAGGLTYGADVAEINLAARVGDGERIVIPTIALTLPTAEAPTAAATGEPLLVNVNSATLDELEQLPGIGPVLGERIIAYREQNGPFTSLDELTNVDGISSGLLQRLRPYLTLDG